MFHVIIYQPEIPSNTGNLIRLSSNTGCELHLVEPMGFELDDRKLRRAGLDYRDTATVLVHPDFESCRKAIGTTRLLTFSTHHQRCFGEFQFKRGDTLVFGPETRGLPSEVTASVKESHQLTIPMRPGSRSLNLSNSVAVVVYEGWRQLGYLGA